MLIYEISVILIKILVLFMILKR